MTSGRRHEVVVLALPETMTYEVGLSRQFLGSAADADGNRLYRVRVASLDGGPCAPRPATRCCPNTTRRSWRRRRPSSFRG